MRVCPPAHAALSVAASVRAAVVPARRMLGSRPTRPSTQPAADSSPGEHSGEQRKDDGSNVRALTAGSGVSQRSCDGEKTHCIENKKGAQSEKNYCESTHSRHMTGLPNGSRLSCGRLARQRKVVGRQSVPARAQRSASLKAITARQLQALVRRQPSYGVTRSSNPNGVHVLLASRRGVRGIVCPALETVRG